MSGCTVYPLIEMKLALAALPPEPLFTQRKD
jgi:hypothetical protein